MEGPSSLFYRQWLHAGHVGQSTMLVQTDILSYQMNNHGQPPDFSSSAMTRLTCLSFFFLVKRLEN